MRRIFYYISLACIVTAIMSCTYSKEFTTDYYKQNESLLQSILQRYKSLNNKRPFSLEIKDRALTRIGLEIHTDTIRYIYNFRLDETYFLDTMAKYQLDIKEMSRLINDMQKAHCTWITSLDYYESGARKELIFISVRHKKLNAFLRPEKYFTLAFFDRPQPFDSKGRLLDRADRKTLRKINGEIFRSIKPGVFYAIMENFR